MPKLYPAEHPMTPSGWRFWHSNTGSVDNPTGRNTYVVAPELSDILMVLYGSGYDVPTSLLDECADGNRWRLISFEPFLPFSEPFTT